MPQNKLTSRSVETSKQRGRYSDGEGLVLQISRWGTKSWVFRYEGAGRDRHMGLGPLHTLSLAAAREIARECRLLLLKGIDPIEERRARRRQHQAETARQATFRDCAEKYLASHRAEWRNAKHRAQWSSTLAAFAYPVIGDLSVAAIDTALVLKCVEPIWERMPETAKRLRGRVENILDWAAARGFRAKENPARWRGHLDKLLPAPRKIRAVKHHAALPYPELPAFMGDLRQRQDLGARALELTVLTALRTGEVIGARRSEIDFAAKIWTVPGERMKGAREHRVPLSKRAIDILGGLPDGERLFPRRDGRPLSNKAMLKTLELMGRGEITVHGFRSTFRDWAAETTAYPNHVVEMALAHAIGSTVEAAYRRGDLFEKRRRLMDEWARYCARAAAVAGSNVASLRTGMN